jgi:hypothetical protein
MKIAIDRAAVPDRSKSRRRIGASLTLNARSGAGRSGDQNRLKRRATPREARKLSEKAPKRITAVDNAMTAT